MIAKTIPELNRRFSSFITTTLAILCLVVPAHTASAGPKIRTISVSGNLSFGTIRIGTNAQATMTISNASTGNGNLSLSISGITLPAGFSTTFKSVSINPGKTTTAIIKFTPTAGQTYSGLAVV